MGVYEALSEIQKTLKAPKGQYNSFGKYYYRNCEDILEAVKPLLNGASLYIFDELVLIGDRYYIKATVVFKSEAEEIKATAYAREEQDKKGMDASQITGAASSYARKYALNGLFLIDDTKDSDATNKHGKATESEGTEVGDQKQGVSLSPSSGGQGETKISDAQSKRFYAISKGSGKTDDDIHTYIKSLGLASSKDLTKGLYDAACEWAKGASSPMAATITTEDISNLRAIMSRAQVVDAAICTEYNIQKLEDLPAEHLNLLIDRCQARIDRAAELAKQKKDKAA
jgi:hypothetical protein